MTYATVHRDLSAVADCGFHSFRRFRISQLRRARIHEDLIRYWVGHAAQSMTDHYSRIAEDLELRQASVSQAGLGFVGFTLRRGADG